MVILFINIIFPVHMATNEKQKVISAVIIVIIFWWNDQLFLIYMHWITLKNLYNLLRLNWGEFWFISHYCLKSRLSVKRVLDGLLLCQKSWMSSWSSCHAGWHPGLSTLQRPSQCSPLLKQTLATLASVFQGDCISFHTCFWVSSYWAADMNTSF